MTHKEVEPANPKLVGVSTLRQKFKKTDAEWPGLITGFDQQSGVKDVTEWLALFCLVAWAFKN